MMVDLESEYSTPVGTPKSVRSGEEERSDGEIYNDELIIKLKKEMEQSKKTIDQLQKEKEMLLNLEDGRTIIA